MATSSESATYLFEETTILDFLSMTLGDDESDEDEDKFRLYSVLL